MQAWRAEHLPRRGRWWLGGRPLVHRGFWQSWSAHGVGDRVISYIGGILKNSKLPAADWTVYLTGDMTHLACMDPISLINNTLHREMLKFLCGTGVV